MREENEEAFWEKGSGTCIWKEAGSLFTEGHTFQVQRPALHSVCRWNGRH